MRARVWSTNLPQGPLLSGISKYSIRPLVPSSIDNPHINVNKTQNLAPFPFSLANQLYFTPVSQSLANCAFL